MARSEYSTPFGYCAAASVHGISGGERHARRRPADCGRGPLTVLHPAGQWDASPCFCMFFCFRDHIVDQVLCDEHGEVKVCMHVLCRTSSHATCGHSFWLVTFACCRSIFVATASGKDETLSSNSKKIDKNIQQAGFPDGHPL